MRVTLLVRKQGCYLNEWVESQSFNFALKYGLKTSFPPWVALPLRICTVSQHELLLWLYTERHHQLIQPENLKNVSLTSILLC